MNTKTLIAAATLALVGASAFAQDVQNYPAPSTLTRAEVLADLARAQAEGRVTTQSSVRDEAEVVAARNGSSTSNPNATRLARVDVKRDLARADSSESVLGGEAYGTVNPGASVLSREAVRAEAIAAVRARFAVGNYQRGG
jgi:hypothetical protein